MAVAVMAGACLCLQRDVLVASKATTAGSAATQRVNCPRGDYGKKEREAGAVNGGMLSGRFLLGNPWDLELAILLS